MKSNFPVFSYFQKDTIGKSPIIWNFLESNNFSGELRSGEWIVGDASGIFAVMVVIRLRTIHYYLLTIH
jgi:hypothetical protein